MTDKTPRISLPPAVREYVFERDRYQCQGCHKIDISAKDLQVDHIQPLAKGGSNDFSNLQTLCSRCNLQKSDKIDSRFRRLYSDPS